MNNLYFKGLSTDNQELEKIRSMFQENDLNLSVVFDSYANLPLISKDRVNSTIDDGVRRCNPIGHNINLICHSMGCNLGVLNAERSSKINKIVLISPEFGEYSKKEERKIEEEKVYPTIQRPFGEKGKRISGATAKTIALFNRTKPWATLAIERVNVPVLIIYSKDDIFIPQEYLGHLADRKDNIEIEVIDSKLHNPLTSIEHGSKTMSLIKKYLK